MFGEKIMENKTNAQRMLDKIGAKYKCYHYNAAEGLSGAEIAAVLGQNPQQVFKTLVTVAKSKQHYVFMLPVEAELDLKKAASVVGEKNLEMIKQKELLPLTGYVHGGCSPIGMKKVFPTVVDKSADNFETIIFSAGRVGMQIETSLENLQKIIVFDMADVCRVS